MLIPSIPARFIPADETVYKKWRLALNNFGILYLHGAFATGKSVNAVHFAGENYKEIIYHSANEKDFFESLEDFFSNFRKKRQSTLLILDDIQWIIDDNKQSQLFALLLKRSKLGKSLQIILLSRGALPEYLKSLQITQHLECVNGDCILFNEQKILQLFTMHDGLKDIAVSNLKTLAQHCFSITFGHALSVQTYALRLIETPHDLDTVTANTMRDIYRHLDTYFMPEWPASHRDYLISLGVFSSFQIDTAKSIIGDNAEKILADFFQMGSFLQFEAPDTYHFRKTFAEYLSYRVSALDARRRGYLYLIAARYYENRRDFAEALRCYRLAGDDDKIAQIVVYLLENADGCLFAELSADYMDVLTPEREQQNLSIIGARAMFAAYRMEIDELKQYLAKLKSLSTDGDTPEIRREALDIYLRTLVASPCVSAEEMRKNLIMCVKYVQQNGISIRNIMPTGNFPSVMNGGLDLLPLIAHRSTLFPIMKKASVMALGIEGVGAADTCLGESFYQEAKSSKAMASLAQALSDANFKGSIRVQYAATACMAQIFQSEGQIETALDILHNVYDKAVLNNFSELLPNISASLIQCSLLTQDVDACTYWLETLAPSEHKPFYITSRFGLITKARVYVSLGRDMEAIHIIKWLLNYADLYHRPCLEIELHILMAIVLYRQGDDDCESELISALELTRPYGLIRFFADQGAALLPLWKSIDWTKYTQFTPSYISDILKAMNSMATYYPKYLQIPPKKYELSDKELAVLRLMMKGSSNTEIATELSFTRSNAKFHVSNIIKKFGVENRTAVVKLAHEQGII